MSVAFAPKIKAVDGYWTAALGRPVDDGNSFWTEELNIYPNSGTHFSKVNETAADSDSTYVYSTSDSVAHRDRYWFGNYNQTIPSNSTDWSVDIYAVCRSMSPTYKADFRIVIGIVGLDAQYSSVFSPSTSYTTIHYNGGDLWGTAISYGIEITAGYDERRDIHYNGRCTQMYIIVTYFVPT